ncbi:MAG: hypothetical protein KGJ07_02050 [Patescibacteria group bacterium]|nr:hypothetical protein [Patescibacteria group bacterium]
MAHPAIVETGLEPAAEAALETFSKLGAPTRSVDAKDGTTHDDWTPEGGAGAWAVRRGQTVVSLTVQSLGGGARINFVGGKPVNASSWKPGEQTGYPTDVIPGNITHVQSVFSHFSLPERPTTPAISSGTPQRAARRA